MPDVDAGLGRRVLDTYEYYQEVFESYPNVKSGVAMYHPDLQGPFDDAHLLIGSDIYMELYDNPDFVHGLLQLITDTYIQFMHRTLSLIGSEFDGYNYHWGSIYKGNITLRNDSAVSLSPDMYREFSMKYDDIIAKEFKSAGMHYCGQNEVWLPAMLQEADIRSLNFGDVPSKTYGEEFLKIAKDFASERQIPIVNYPMTRVEFDGMKDEHLKCGTTFRIIGQKT